MVQDDDAEKAEAKTMPFKRRLKWWLAALALLAAGVGLFGRGLLNPMGSGPAGPSVPETPFRKVWSDRKVLLLGIGDSITAGYGARREFSYFDRLAHNPPGDSEDMIGKNLSVVFPNLSARNTAVSGTDSMHHLNKQIGALETHPADVLGIVVMTTGGNDIIHDYGRSLPRECAMYGAALAHAKPWIANYEKRLHTMVARIKGAFPGGCHIFLANIFDPTDGTGNPGSTGLPLWPDALAILRAYNEVIARCADKHDFVHLVDIHGPFLGHGIHFMRFWLKHYRLSDPHYWYSIVEDPNERGYDAIRRLFLLEMAEVFVGGMPPAD